MLKPAAPDAHATEADGRLQVQLNIDDGQRDLGQLDVDEDRDIETDSATNLPLTQATNHANDTNTQD